MSLDATLRALERASRSGDPAATRAYLVAECRARTGHALEPACWLSRGPERPFVPGHLWSCCSCGEASVSVPSGAPAIYTARLAVDPEACPRCPETRPGLKPNRSGGDPDQTRASIDAEGHHTCCCGHAICWTAGFNDTPERCADCPWRPEHQPAAPLPGEPTHSPTDVPS